jgi:hypothetical protein
MSFLPVRRNGLIAVLLIVFSAVSIVPPADAFTVSRLSQTHILETMLQKNNMLQDNAVVPNDSIPETDKAKIASSASYLSRMDYIDRVSFLPEGFDYYTDAYETFGFLDVEYSDSSYRVVNLYFDPEEPIAVTGYDFMARIYLNREDRSRTVGTLEKDGLQYALLVEDTGEFGAVVLQDSTGRELLRFDAGEIFRRYEPYGRKQVRDDAGGGELHGGDAGGEGEARGAERQHGSRRSQPVL